MSTAIVRGPLKVLLQTSAGQYVLIGMGAYVLFPEKFHRLLEHSPHLLKLIPGSNNQNNDRSNQPIIIHTPAPTIYGGHGGRPMTWMGTAVYAAVGCGACWAGYIVAVQVLPDAIGQFLPVTRAIFDKTTQSLGKGILSCKKVLEEKIMILSGQQDELGKKQDETNKTVSHIKSELGEARIDLSMLRNSLSRCEGSLEKSEGLQEFTLRGVRLLVRCVANILPENIENAHDLARFIEEEEQQQRLLDNGSSTPHKSSVIVSEDQENIPVATAITPAPSSKTTRLSFTPSFTPSLLRGRKQSDVSASKKKMMDENSDEANLSDIRALLGH